MPKTLNPKGRWGLGDKRQDHGVLTKDPLARLPSSHLLSPLIIAHPFLSQGIQGLYAYILK